MDFEQIKALIDHVDASSLYEFALEREDVKLSMSKRKEAAGVEKASASTLAEDSSGLAVKQEEQAARNPEKEDSEPVLSETEDLHVLKAPIVGTGYLSSSPEAAPFVKEGDRVTTGQTLCIIEAMKVMNEIKSDVDGEIVSILIEDEQPVEFNQALIKIKTD
ncbi:Biotin carboxyl carrier protein of acetyl-CoA carboxylase [Alkalibacterium sp. AK22]|uniref:acetyl-CoA carboxylase biotin carboxyl carrier protein n=1 Tax=Alkalibacterium sp. AK22 TaxID=1229520 RepID=UPI000450861B|nr:acetyl-CoA carboxylase biotin carboxyl carrier protein [Alkalibacterium sp. AK22]EXJ24168.1 Biotin carboxyl carrier protein of acetyl-CoA carboxylase [Alkalibacterium sp. AK22]